MKYTAVLFIMFYYGIIKTYFLVHIKPDSYKPITTLSISRKKRYTSLSFINYKSIFLYKRKHVIKQP